MKLGDTLELEITGITSAGEGLGRMESLVVFVPFTAVGDRVRVEITQTKKSFARARVTQLLTAGPARAEPVCPYYGHCGGCQYQHLTYAEELRLKEAHVAEAFRRIAKMPEIALLPILACPEAYGYRNRITVHSAGGKTGFHGIEPGELVDVEKCALAHPAVNEELKQLRQRKPATGHYSLRHPDLPRSAFFQTNHFLLDTLYHTVIAAVDPQSPVCVDAYCGGGFFTRGLTAPGRTVVGIEQDGRALRDAARLQLVGARFIEGAVEDFLETVLREQTEPVTVVADPPRTGLPGPVRRALMEPGVKELVYVSCDPATLARDAVDLKNTFRLVTVQPVDLFPRTAQIECVTVWQRLG